MQTKRKANAIPREAAILIFDFGGSKAICPVCPFMAKMYSVLCWYVDFKTDNTKYIVLKDLVLKYEIGNYMEKESVLKKCIELGIPMEQLDWSES